MPTAHLLYPANPLRPSQPDEHFAAEMDAVRAAGFGVSVLAFEEFQEGRYQASPALPAGSWILYRGWMLSIEDYQRLGSAITSAGSSLAVSHAAYRAGHHLPGWYPLLADLTPETRIYAADCDLESELRALAWPGFFIKDYVKSLKTASGSKITRPEQGREVMADMRRFRGVIEGGICVRRLEEFLPDTEQRFFVLDATGYSSGDEVPPIVHECARRLPIPFFSVDVARRADGILRVVEVGDGQVSDLVGWTPAQFAAILTRHFLKDSP